MARPLVSGDLITPVRLFIISTMVVNAGNYGYNLVLGRMLSPAYFAEAGLLITLLLVFSFLAMTFQIVATKFSIEYEGHIRQAFLSWFRSKSLWAGAIIGIGLVSFSQSLAGFFKLSSPWTVVIFGIVLPCYFLMSVDRGLVQGKENFIQLSKSYQAEMWVRFLTTLIFIWFFGQAVGISISASILISIVAGYFANGTTTINFRNTAKFEFQRKVWHFFMLTAAYECAQILINYSDILLVKHYFEAHEAGLYTSMALIGRMIYFVTWMVVMVLIPKVVKRKKSGQPYQAILTQYLMIISLVSLVIIGMAYLFPNEIVMLLFGSAYLPIAPLLWLYGLATALFALANIFVYFFLSMDQYTPVFIAIGMGLVQVLLLTQFHSTLKEIIGVQIINMGILLCTQLVFFATKK